MKPAPLQTLNLSLPAKAHFIGVAGAGMSAVARMMLDLGWEISGSDEAIYPPISDTLSSYGITCASPYNAANIPEEASIIVIGKNAKLLPESNPEVAAAYAHSATVVSFPQILSALTAAKQSLVVAGSYGKSTTSSLLAWLLQSAGKRPSYFIGAAAKNFTDYGHVEALSDLFVLEGDEYPAANWDDRSKFEYYHADCVLLTSAEHDHVNVFPTHEQYLQPFYALVSNLPEDGLLVACAEGNSADAVAAKSAAKTIWYGLNYSESTSYWASAIRIENGITYFDVVHNHTVLLQAKTALLGRAFIQNCIGAVALLNERALLTPGEIQRGIASFLGVKRRLELRGYNPCPVYEDFGSSYPKCRAGIETLLEAYPEKELVVVFDPHTFSFRSREALDWYDTLFLGCSAVLVLPPPTLGSPSDSYTTQDEIVSRIAGSGVASYMVPSKEEASAWVAQKTTGGNSVVLVTSSGAIEPVIAAILNV